MLPQREHFEGAAHKPILSAAHAANILISYSCRSGQCGSCLGRVLEGEINYPNGFPDAISTQQANSGYALLCSAHPCSNLVIELCKPEFPDD